MKSYVYQDRKGEWRWSLVGRNGRIVADSGEGYKSRRGALKACERMGSIYAVTAFSRPDVAPVWPISQRAAAAKKAA